MKRLAIILVALCLLAGCTKQAEYGPKAPQRYSRKWQTLSFSSGVATVVDSVTGETWLIYHSTYAVALLRHTGGEP